MKFKRSQQIITTIFPGIILLFSLIPGEAQANTFKTLDRPSKELSLADRHYYQRSIEEVYRRHRTWPKERSGSKPSLDEIMSPAQIEQKVEKYLRDSQALEEPIRAAQLQAEMDRMARNTKQPGMLRELFAALGSDPFVIAECLARPTLSERLVAGVFKNQGPSGNATLQTLSNEYVLPNIVETVSDLSGMIAAKAEDTGVPMSTEGCGWTGTSQTNAPTPRSQATAVWTGSEMIVWGGVGPGTLDTGGRYNPATDSWAATSQTNAPSRRYYHTAIWTGSEMIIWGGLQGANFNTGARYNPGTDTWTTTSTTNAPEGRSGHVAVWTGTEMIVWGGTGNGTYNTGGRYSPGTDSWATTSVIGAPTARYIPSAVWTGSEMIIWGGGPGGGINNFNTGGKYNPATDSWTSTSVTNAPPGRYLHTAVWTGSEMVVWGGYEGGFVNTGGKYDSANDSWTSTNLTNAPSARGFSAAVWTGKAMVIWGGSDRDQGAGNNFNDGRIYNTATDSWTATDITNAPTARAGHTAVWTGSEMIIWGGSEVGANLNTGGRLCLTSGPTPTPSPSTLGNISTRLRVETGNNILIGGFIVAGTQAKNVIVRAIGPSLGVPGLLVDPVLELRDSSGALLNSNDNWRDTQEAQIIATTVPPTNNLEAAIVATLPANNSAYTAIVRGKDNGTGVALVEVYDLDRSVDSRLANISTRGPVGTGNDVMIGGTIVLGTSSTNVVLRGIGPSLTTLGIPDALVDPTLELRDGSGALVVANDNWQDDSTSAAHLTTLGLAPQNPLESGIFTSLPPGFYTIIMAGKNNGTGVGLVEAYHVQ